MNEEHIEVILSWVVVVWDHIKSTGRKKDVRYKVQRRNEKQ